MPHTRLPWSRRTRAAALLLAAAAAAAGAAACGQDPLAAAAGRNQNNIPINPLVVFPFSTAPASLNTAISVGGFGPVRPAVVEAGVPGGAVLVPNFDFAVDVGADGRIRFIPAKLLANLTGSGRVLRTGIQAVNTPFDSLTDAPSGGYQRDSVTAVARGQTLAVEAEPLACGNGRTFLYAKLVVDSVPASGGIYMRAMINPNCGFRSLRPGQPTS